MKKGRVIPAAAMMVVVALVAMSAVLPVVSAQTIDIDLHSFERTEILYNSVNSDLYPKINNVADPEYFNSDTWYVPLEGVFIGGVTPETKLRLNQDGPGISIEWNVTFRSDQIMDGSSKFRVRSPFEVENDWVSQTIVIFNPEGIAAYVTGHKDSPSNILTVIDKRAYWTVDAFILPGVDYRIRFSLSYDYYRPHHEFWVSPNDVASDLNMGMSIRTGLHAASVMECDPGVSFDFIRGAGGGVAGVEIVLEEGQSIMLNDAGAPSLIGQGFHQILIPFIGDDSYRLRVHVYAMTRENPILPFLDWVKIIDVTRDWTNNIITHSQHRNNQYDTQYRIFLTAVDGSVNITMPYVPATQFNASYVIPEGVDFTSYDYVVFPESDPILMSLRMRPVMTSTPTASPWQGFSTEDEWAIAQLPPAPPMTKLEFLTITLLDVAMMPLTLMSGVEAGVAARDLVYNKIYDGTIGPEGWIKNTIDDVLDIFDGVVDFVVGIGEALIMAVVTVLDAVLDSLAWLAGFISILIIQVLFFFIISQIVRFGEMAISIALGNSERARKINDGEGVRNV